MPENAKKPQIRFKGFTDAWEQRKVSNLFKVARGYVLPATFTSNKKTIETPYPVYSSQTKENGLMGFYKDYLYNDAITWTTDGANAGTVQYRTGKFYCTNVCGVLLSNKVKANQMIAEALNNVAKNYVSYVGNPKLMNNVMADIEIILSKNQNERESISKLFYTLDNLITLHQRKLDKLKNIKKSMLEKMFPKNGSNVPEIRFTGFTDAWEQRKLGEIANIVGGGTPSTSISEYWNGDIDWYAPAEMEGKRYANGSAKKITKLGLQNCSAQILPAGRTILFTSRAGIGKMAILKRPGSTNQGFQSLVLNQEINPYFIYSLCDEIKEKAESVAAGSTFLEISGKALGNIEILMPKELEQNKVSNYFLKLDNLITLHQRKLEKLQNIKKACLEKMFV